MSETSQIGMVVFFLGIIRTDHRRGRYQDLPLRIAFLERSLKPLPLVRFPRVFCWVPSSMRFGDR